jgi:hypothetical protein
MHRCKTYIERYREKKERERERERGTERKGEAFNLESAESRFICGKKI